MEELVDDMSRFYGKTTSVQCVAASNERHQSLEHSLVHQIVIYIYSIIHN